MLLLRRWLPRSGLRWYKNRVVVNYDMDAKNLLKAQPSDSEDGVNKLLTMSYVTASRLLLANSFGTLDSAHVYKLSRIYPSINSLEVPVLWMLLLLIIQGCMDEAHRQVELADVFQ